MARKQSKEENSQKKHLKTMPHAKISHILRITFTAVPLAYSSPRPLRTP
jgi:heme/copper-type cytochrome/quinol oxidase subunit 4